MRFGILLVTLFISLGSAIAATDKVLCYFATWSYSRTGNGKVLPEDIDPTLCTHLLYAFAGVDHDGNLEVLDQDFDVGDNGYKRVSDLKQKNSNLKVLISIGGYTAGWEVFSAVSLDPQKRANFAKSCLTFLQTYNYDGVDIDWEYPIEQDRESYITMLQEIKDAFKEGGYLLSAAVPYNPIDAAYNVSAMSGVLDFINVMTYDFHSSWAGITCHDAPLYGSPNESQWQRETLNTNSSIINWLNAGASPDRLVLGIPFYGRAFILQDPSNHDVGSPAPSAAPAGPFTKNQGTLGYNELCEFHKDAHRDYDSVQQAAYLYEDTLWVGYDDPQSIAAKVQYAKDNGLAGVMIWSIETDDVFGVNGTKWGLLKAINDNI